MQPAWVRYGYGILAVVTALGVAMVSRAFDLEGFIFVIAVAAAVWFGGRGPGIVAVLLSALVLDYFFLPAVDTRAIVPSHVTYFVVFAVLALVISLLGELRHRAEQTLVRSRDDLEVMVQERTATLRRTNQQLRDEIAERQRAEEEIRRQAALLGLAHDAILVRDFEDRVVFWNRGAEEVYGWSAHEALGRVTHDLLRTQFPAPYDTIRAHVDQHGNWEGELTHIRRDGNVIVVASRWSLQRDHNGAMSALMEINRDVTDRKRAEDALRSAETALAHVSRVATLGEVTASFAHEVNQPLAAIANNANACLGMLPDGRAELEEIRSALDDIVSDAERASAVIARVRALARRATTEMAPLRVEDVVQDVVALTSGDSASRRVHVRTEVPADLPRVSGDRVQLQQVVLNLVVNAMDAMAGVEPQRRVLLIRARSQREHDGAVVTISVEDGGVGLDGLEMERLFDAFYTTKDSGMGMGLAISRTIIAAHGGRLWAESNAGAGATFTFSLPAVTQA